MQALLLEEKHHGMIMVLEKAGVVDANSHVKYGQKRESKHMKNQRSKSKCRCCLQISYVKIIGSPFSTKQLLGLPLRYFTSKIWKLLEWLVAGDWMNIRCERSWFMLVLFQSVQFVDNRRFDRWVLRRPKR